MQQAELDGVLDPAVTEFVDRNVRSLLTWDLLVFLHERPGVALDLETLSAMLGRRSEAIGPEVDLLCRNGVLECVNGEFRYAAHDQMREAVGGFVGACRDKSCRLALIARVLRSGGARTAGPV